MDAEMEDAMDLSSPEVDFAYEFDAPRFIDLGRAESPDETRAAELWFCFAPSYPPSPFVAALNIGIGVLVENVNTLSKFKDTEDTNSITDHSDIASGLEFSLLDGGSKGLKCPSDDVPDKKSSTKGSFLRSTAFIKPSGIQSAKRNQPREIKNGYKPPHRCQKPMVVKNEKTFVHPSDNGSQAPKRQKLEGGHLCKVVGITQQPDLVHKAPQKKNELSTCNSHYSKLKITIPREPQLLTAQRAQRLRSKTDKDLQEQMMLPTRMFKARPLNRKILEAPSLPLHQKSTPQLPQFHEFNFNTYKRATELSSAASSSLKTSSHKPSCSVEDGVGGSGRAQCQISSIPQLQNDDMKLEDYGEMKEKFKARPLDKKIFSSKGDIGVFRSTKRETTRPMEFNLSSSKRCQQNPPTELFSKLCLNSEAQESTACQTKVPWLAHVADKGSKENVINPAQAGHSSTQMNKEEFLSHGKNQIQYDNGAVSGLRSQANTSRSMGIR